MKSVRFYILTALLVALGLSIASDSYAQRHPRRGHRDSVTVRERHRDGGVGHRDHAHPLLHYFTTNQDCLDQLLAQMSEEDASALTRLMESMKGLREQREALHTRIRAARADGDTAAFRAGLAELRELSKQHGQAHRMLNALFQKYHEAIRTLLENCGNPPPRDGDGQEDDRDDQRNDDRGVITPNPVEVGGTATLNLTLASETSVGVRVMGQDGAVLTIPAALLPAGEQTIALDVSTLARGLYMVEVQIGDRRHMLKLMIR